MLVPQRGTPKGSVLNMDPKFSTKKTQEDYSLTERVKDYVAQSTDVATGAGETPEDASITPPSEWGSTVNTHEGSFKPLDNHNDQPRPFTANINNTKTASEILESEGVLLTGGQKKVHFAMQNDSRLHGNSCSSFFLKINVG